MGLITCLSGSSYFFIIAVIIILRRQFQKPQQETATQQRMKTTRQIELQSSPKLAEDQPGTSKTPKLVPEVCARTAAKLEDGAEANGRELLTRDGRVSSTNTTQVRQRPGSLTETTADVTALPSGRGGLEAPEQKSEQEAKEECCETNAQVDKDKLDHQMNEKQDLETETPVKNTDSQ